MTAALVIVLIAVDQAIKYVIPATLNTPHVPLYFSITITTALWIWLYKANGRRYITSGLMLMIAGGVSNIIDQLVHNSVLDIINAGTLSFNIADVYIVFGSILIITASVAKVLPRLPQ